MEILPFFEFKFPWVFHEIPIDSLIPSNRHEITINHPLNHPYSHSMGDLWMIYGWFMDDLWMIYGWFMGDLWMIYGWFMDDLWMIYGWFMDDLWVIYGWFMDDLWMIYGWFMGDLWVIYGWFMGDLWVIPSIFLQFQLRPQLSAQLPPHAEARQRRIQRKVTGGRHGGAGAILAEQRKRFWWKKTQKKTGKNREMSGKRWENQENLGKWCGQVEKVRKTSWSHQQKFSINLQEAIWFYPRIYRFLWMFSPRLGDGWEWLRPPINMVILGMVYDIALTTL